MGRVTCCTCARRNPAWALRHSLLALLLACARLPGVSASEGLQPTINDVNPMNGPTKGGSIITISGTNFGTGNTNVQPTATVGGAACQQVVWVSSTSLLCETPDGVGGHKSVMVSVAGMNSAPDQDAIFNYDPPTVEAIEPGHGAASGGTMVTIIGSNFGATNNNPSVTIGGRPCQNVVWLSNSKLQCLTPAGIGIGDVRVFILDESSPENFGTIFEFDAPLITRLVPDHGPGTGGITLTVHGTNFGTLDSKPQIKVGGSNCQSTAWKSNTEVLCVTPKGQGLSKDVLVDILGQPSKSAANIKFSYNGPSVTALDPNNGPTIGGNEVTVYGENFGTAADSKRLEVRVGEVPCSSQTWISHSAIVCVAPSGTGINKDVQVQVASIKSEPCTEKQLRHNLCASRYLYDAPVIGGVEPAHGPTTGGYYVNIPGHNYGTSPSALKIMMGKAECEKTNWVSNSMAQCLVPAGVGRSDVVVEVDGQKSSLKDEKTAGADAFTYDAPVIQSVIPSVGSPTGGQLITIEGYNFGTEKSEVEVLVGHSPGRVVQVTEDRVVAVMPQGEGEHVISLLVASQESTSATAPASSRWHESVVKGASSAAAAPHTKEMLPPVSDEYKYKGPRITGVTPVHGATQGGNVITILGNDFGGVGTPVKIQIGGFECIETTWISDTATACTSPPGAGGDKDVTLVVDSKYRAAAPASLHFSYSAPAVRAVTPDTGALEGGTRIVIQGVNFGLTDSHPVAFVGPTRCRATEWTDDAAVACITPGVTRMTAAWGAGPTINPVTLRVNGQRSAENMASAFEFGSQASPVITSLAWTRAPTEGGFTITLFGSKFEDNDSVALVGRYVTPPEIAIAVADKQDNGNPAGGPAPAEKAPPMASCRRTVWVSESKVLCTAPAGVGSGLAVAIKTRDFALAQTFGNLVFEYDPPVVTAISRTSGSIAGGLDVTVTGYGFGLADTSPAVDIGPEACLRDAWISDSSMLCTTPPGQGASTVAVQVGGQWSVKGSKATEDVPRFLYEGSSITAVSPDFAPTTGGTLITLYANDFGAKSGPLEALVISRASYASGVAGGFGSSAAPNSVEHACLRAAWVSDTSVTCTLPAGVGGALDVQVMLGPSKHIFRGLHLFSYAAPLVSGVTAATGNSAGGLPVTLTGSNFGTADNDPTAYVGDTRCSRTLYLSDDKVVCVTPPGGGASLSLSVSVAEQHGPPLPDAFAYAPPSVSGVTPDAGPISGNGKVTISGNNFGRSAASRPQAYVGKRACVSTTWVSNQQLICVTPRGGGQHPLKKQFVTVKVQGVFTPALKSVGYTYMLEAAPVGAARVLGRQAYGSKSEIVSSVYDKFHRLTREARLKLRPSARAPGMYLSIAYLVAFGITVATVVMLRLLFFRKAGSHRRSHKLQRGFFARITNKLFGRILRTTDDGDADASVYHIVDSIDIEMEASSEIDMVQHLRPVDR